MIDKVTATPRPWHVDHAPWMGLKFGVMYQGSVVAECREITPDADRANAAHIVKCVNYHERLVEALRKSLFAMEDYEEKVDSEWGMCRTIEQMTDEGVLPEEIINVRKLLNELEVKSES